MKKLFTIIFILLTFWLAGEAQEQTAPEKSAQTHAVYKLEFVLRELQDGKVINTRNYMMMAAEHERAQTKSGARVPVRGAKDDFQYLDVGVNINCDIKEESPLLLLDANVQISSFALPEQKATAGLNELPVLSQAQANESAAITPGKQTVIGSIDDASSTRRYEIAVTATKIR